MELKDVLERRHSCRKFIPGYAIPPWMLGAVIVAAQRAPYASGGPRRDIVLITPDGLSKLQEACFDQKWVGESGCAFVIAGNDLTAMLRSGHPKYVHDCDAAAMCMILRAVDLGLGCCWIGHFDPEKVAKVASLSAKQRPVVVVILGWEAFDGTD